MKFFSNRNHKNELATSLDELDHPVNRSTQPQVVVDAAPRVLVAVEESSEIFESTEDQDVVKTHCSSKHKVVVVAMPPEPERRKSYYDGSSEIATETRLTITRLEPRRKLTSNSQRLVIALVGLPARGKSFVARKLEAYLNWSGATCKIFNVGKYRRKAYAEMLAEHGERTKQSSQTEGACSADFFDPNNAQAAALRERVAEVAMIDMLKWLDSEDQDEEAADMTVLTREASNLSLVTAAGGAKLEFEQQGRVAIFDATNSTQKRRQWILEQCTSPEKRKDKPTGVVFVESVCDDQELIEENFRYKVSISPDYKGMSEEEALADLRKRVEKYEAAYETVDDDSHSYIKIFNLSTKILVNHIYGRMAKDLVPAVMAWHIGTRPVYLCRPGQTITGIQTDGEDYVALQTIDPSDPRFLDMSTRTRRRSLRGDSLGPLGKKFRQALLDFCYKEAHEFMLRRASVRDMAYTGTSISGLVRGVGPDSMEDACPTSERNRETFPLKLMTSTMPRAVDTVTWEEFDLTINQMSNLNPLDKGDFAGMELEEIQNSNPKWYEKLQQDPFGTRFLGGESYRDLIRRVNSVVIDVEQQVNPTLVVSHVSILQCLMAYFRNTPVKNCMSIEVPMHTVIKYTPVRGGGWLEEIVPLVPLYDCGGSGGGSSVKTVESASEISCMSGAGNGITASSDASTPIWSDHNAMSVSSSALFTARHDSGLEGDAATI